MNQQNQKPEKQKEQPRFNKEQYEMLKRCSEKRDITEWNEWRYENPIHDVEMERAPLDKFKLEGADFNPKTLSLQECVKRRGEKVSSFAFLSWAQLSCAHLEGAQFELAQMETVSAHRAHFEGANLRYAHLNNALLAETHLEGVCFDSSHLKGANFERAIVDGETSLWKCEVDRETNFEGVALDIVRIDPGTKQLLEYNIRRKNWEEWYKNHPFLKYPIRLFWSFSDYGLSTWRVIGTFLISSLLFAAIYSIFAFLSPPGIVSNLEVEPHLPLWHYGLLVFLRPIYFSVVTMTTLGFGDMYANAQSIWGHILLTFQVIIGYVLLGALVTRFAVLFTAGGPAGKFADEMEKSKVKSKRAKPQIKTQKEE